MRLRHRHSWDLLSTVTRSSTLSLQPLATTILVDIRLLIFLLIILDESGIQIG